MQAAPLPEPGGEGATTTADAASVGFSCSKPDVVRVGFTCSKKVGNAVARNRARRRLKAAVDDVFPEAARPGLDYVVIGRQETAARPYSLLLQDLRTALKRVGGLKLDEPRPEAAQPAAGSARE